MTRILHAALAALALTLAAPAIAGDCHGDCANCPHRAGAAKADDKAAADPKATPPCACAGGKECKCPQGCKCDHCAGRKDAPKAPAKG